MASTYEPIASQTLGSDSATITFDNIAATWTDLVLQGMAFTKFSSAGNGALYVRFNSDSGNNYSRTLLRGNGSTASSARNSNQSSIEAAPTYATTSSTTSTFHPFRLFVMSYADTNVYKTCLAMGDVSQGYVARTVALWRSTSAITSITISTDATSIMAGSVLSLYGIKAA